MSRRKRQSTLKGQKTAETKVESSSNKSKPKKSIKIENKGIEERLSDMETITASVMEKVVAIDDIQMIVTSIMEKLVELEKKISSLSSLSIKQKIQQLVPKGQSLTMDELSELFDLPGYEWGLIEQAVITLVDDGVFTLTKAKSKKKIAGNYGRITRI